VQPWTPWFWTFLLPPPGAPTTRETLAVKGGTCGRELSGNFA
jgi:hypothetical protein